MKYPVTKESTFALSGKPQMSVADDAQPRPSRSGDLPEARAVDRELGTT